MIRSELEIVRVAVILRAKTSVVCKGWLFNEVDVTSLSIGHVETALTFTQADHMTSYWAHYLRTKQLFSLDGCCDGEDPTANFAAKTLSAGYFTSHWDTQRLILRYKLVLFSIRRCQRFVSFGGHPILCSAAQQLHQIHRYMF